MKIGDLVRLKTTRPYEVLGVIVSPCALSIIDWRVYWLKGLPFSSRKTGTITMEMEDTLELIKMENGQILSSTYLIE